MMLDDNPEEEGKDKKGYTKGVVDETFKSFEKTADRAFDISDTIAAANEATIKLNQSLGGSSSLASTINTTFIDAGQKLLLLTDSVSSLEQGMIKASEVNKSLMDATGRAYIASADELAGIIASQQASGVEASKLITTFKNQGFALEQIPKTIQKVIDTTRQLGVNSAAVTETVVDNISKLNTFNFSNGVEGLTRMAAQAAVVGLDMGKVFTKADEMFDPERAVELASSLQRLGVATGDLLDPLKLMDLGQNNPQELQNQIVEMSKRFTYFNEQNQKFEILPGAKLQLREIGKELGFNADEMAKLAIGSSDLSKKMSEIKFPEMETGPMTEDQRMMIANLSELKGGEYKIKVQETTLTDKGERVATGRVLEKSTSQLTAEDLESLKYSQEQGTKSLEEIALESMGYQKRVANAVEALVSTGRGALVSSNLGNKGQELLSKTLTELVGLTKESVTAKGGRDLLNDVTPALREFGESMVEVYKDGSISEEEKKQLMEKGKGIDEKFMKAFGKSTDVFKKLGEYAKNFPGEVMKALDAATKNIEEGQNTESTSSSNKSTQTEPSYVKAQTGGELMEGVYQSGKGESGLNTATNTQNVSTVNNNESTTNNDYTTNNSTSNNDNSQTLIEGTKNVTNQLANNNPFDLSPMINLQGEELTTSKGSLSELQSLNTNLTNNNQELIKLLSNNDINTKEQKNTQNVSTVNNNESTTNNDYTTNNSTSNNDNSQTLIEGTKNVTNQLANNNPFDLSPMINLQGEELTTSKGSLSELQSLNTNLTNNNQELIKLLSGSAMVIEPQKNPITDNLITQSPPKDNSIQIINAGQNMSDNTNQQKVIDVNTPKNLDVAQMNEMGNTVTQQNNNSTFDGKLTIDVNISAPPGVDVNSIKQVVTEVMYDSKVRENINRNVLETRIGNYNPTTGIPT